MSPRINFERALEELLELHDSYICADIEASSSGSQYERDRAHKLHAKYLDARAHFITNWGPKED
jgi:hypothetical protein